MSSLTNFHTTALPIPRRGAEHLALADCRQILHRLAGLAKKTNVLLVHPRGAASGWIEHITADTFRVCSGRGFTEFDVAEVTIKIRPETDRYSHAIVARDAQKGEAQ